MSVASLRHAVAFVVAAILVFWIKVGDADIQRVSGPFDQRRFELFTPYFPGLDSLETTTAFDPRKAHKKKIVILGASTVDSIGCDYTWHRPEPNQPPNVHYTCSITGQLNDLLREAHLDDWEAFNLARNGSKLTPELYTYARLLVLKPEIVIYGDSFNYYMWENADANALRPDHYAYMDKVFDRYPDTAAIWHDYKTNLHAHGLKPNEGAVAPPDISLAPQPRASTSVTELLVNEIVRLRTQVPFEGPPRSIAYKPTYRDWTKAAYTPHPFVDLDPGLKYFQGIKIIADMQRHLNNKTMFFFCPQWTYDNDLSYQKGLEDEFGAYLRKDKIPFASYVPMHMQPILETYDGYHQGLAGNRKIAIALFHDLHSAKLLP